MTRQSNGAMKLAFNAKSFVQPISNIFIGQCDSSICDKTIEIQINDDWKEYMIPLKDFEKLGLDMSKITSAMFIKADTGTVLGLSNVRLE
jgi:hypothetical protein